MGQIESFSTLPLQQCVPSYLFYQYSDDQDLQAFVSTFNSISQGYLDFFNSTPLGLYTSPNITGPLLDWIGNGIYGIPRPVLSTQTSSTTAGYNSTPYNAEAYNSLQSASSGTASIASDDIYKRVMTWNLYRGDGQMFTIGWLKNRVGRFLNGANGSDFPVLNNPPSITVSGNIFTITVFEDEFADALQQLFSNNELPFPFQYTPNFVNVRFLNDGGVLQMTAPLNYPVSPVGLAAGAIWYNGGTLAVVPGITPNPTAPPVFFNGALTAVRLLALGGGDLPLSPPTTGSLQLWNNGGTISIA
jgi:hypothetical protein